MITKFNEHQTLAMDLRQIVKKSKPQKSFGSFRDLPQIPKEVEKTSHFKSI